jgi:hypothetical protein
MIQLLAPLLGGLGGLLFPAAGAAAAGGAAATGIGALLAKGALPALGAGLGTLVAGGGGKDAIRNALLMGVGVNAFPGLAGKIQGSQFGQSVTEGLAGIFGGGQEQAPMTSPRPMARSEAGLASMSTAGEMPDGGQGMTGMEDEARRRSMTTLPTLQEMASAGFENAQGMGLGSPRMTPTLQEMANQAFASAQGMGMGIPSIPTPLPPVIMPGSNYNEKDRYRGMQSALDMAVDLSREGDIQGAIDATKVYDRLYRPGLRGFAMGGEIEGPGTGTSDSIPAEIYQDGKPVQKAALSDGEFVMTADAVKGAGKGSRERGVSRMYELMRRFESGEMA